MSKRNDISEQIRKYLNGELDARAMHQLEKEAQNDPFLMEALEGYEKVNPDQQKNIDDIHARLRARVNQKEARIIPWRWVSIAASILILLGIGGLWLKNAQLKKEPKQIALTNIVRLEKPSAKPAELAKAAPPVQKSPAPIPNAASRQKQAQAAEIAAPHPVEYKSVAPSASNGYLAESSPLKKNILVDTSKLGEVVITGYATQRRQSITGSVSTITANNFTNGYIAKTPGLKADTSLSPFFGNSTQSKPLEQYKGLTQLNGKVAGLAVSKAKKITGVVKDETGPLPGVTVKIKGTTTGVQTDANGRFSISSVPDNAVLDLAYVGYQTKEVAVNKRDSLNSLVIAMQPNTSSLNEVVVTGYGVKKEQQDVEYEAPQPATGWSEYNKYLKDNAISPDGKTGTVKLSFMVNADNSLSDFKIIKSVSAKTDSAAIDIITNGPEWQKSNSGKAEKVKLRIKFPGK